MKSTLKKLEKVQPKSTEIKLKIPKKVYDQCQYLCKSISKVEWSGVLFYSVEGSIKEPEKMVLTVQDILPMHKGTAGYTEYSFDERVINHIMDNEEAEDWKMGHIHSHNSMDVYFSGTDWSELEDNSPNHNFYLSLIVNNKMEFCAKVAFIVENMEKTNSNIVYKAKDENGITYDFKTEEYNTKKLVAYDCDIQVHTISISNTFKKKVDSIIEEAKLAPKTVFYNGASHLHSGSRTQQLFNPSTGEYQKQRGLGYRSHLRQVQNKLSLHNIGKAALQHLESQEDFEEEQLMERIEEFCACLISGRILGDENKDLDDICEEYRASDVSSKDVQNLILDQYLNVYVDFFDKEIVEDQDNFVDIGEKVVEEFESAAALSVSRYINQILTVAGNTVKAIVEKFKEQ